MDYFVITETVPAIECVEAGFPNPETHPTPWIVAVRRAVAGHIECGAMDLDEATDIVQTALARIRYTTPLLLRGIRSEPEVVPAEVWEDMIA